MQNNSLSPRRLAARWPLIATLATIIALIAVVVLLVTSLPPRSVVMATGPEDSTYHAIGKRYREFFARHRVKLELRPTNGTVDNVELLRDPNSGVDIALIQGGVTDSTQAPALVSLGSMFYEPFWMFTTIEQEDRTTDVLEHVPVSLGAPGSGTYRLGREILAATGLVETRMDLRDLDPIDSGEALLRGEVKFIGMSLPWDAPIVQRLLRDPKVDARIARLAQCVSIEAESDLGARQRSELDLGGGRECCTCSGGRGFQDCDGGLAHSSSPAAAAMAESSSGSTKSPGSSGGSEAPSGGPRPSVASPSRSKSAT